MKKRIALLLWICCSCFAYGQLSCPTLVDPLNGATNVPVDATIEWDVVTGVPGYLISIGTTPGGTEIINEQNVGNASSFKPPLGLPENTDIYVTLTIFFFNQANTVCTTESFRTENVTEPPGCATISLPRDESTNVNVSTSISWNQTPTATEYQLSLGTTPGGTDLLNNENIQGALSYTPTADLPFSTEIFVTLIPRNENGAAIGPCEQFSFTTGMAATLPACTSLINPSDQAINVELSPVLEWEIVPEADGYFVTIGTTPFNANVLDNANFTQNRTLVVEFEPNRTFFITIIPYNDAGEAIGCQQQSFSTILGCGPYFDTTLNQFVDLRPDINFPDTLSFCENADPLEITTEDTAKGFRWYKIDPFDNEELISTGREVTIDEQGRYRYEAFNAVSQSGSTIECDVSKIFEVVSSEIATITNLNSTNLNGTIDITVQTTGNGDYEYAINNIDGPYQDSNRFDRLEFTTHTFYVRDKNGCGIVQEVFEPDLTLEGFPKFFTPNGDEINDFWQFIQPLNQPPITLETIYIFDRFGKLIQQIDPSSKGWDGNFNGQPLPASDYWFRTTTPENRTITGHFTLKR